MSTKKGLYFMHFYNSYGAIKLGVPHCKSALVALVAKPKSIILTIIYPSSSVVMSILSGFKSRCAIPFSWIWQTPRTILPKIFWIFSSSTYSTLFRKYWFNVIELSTWSNITWIWNIQNRYLTFILKCLVHCDDIRMLW